MAAARRAVQQEGEYFALLLDYYLKERYGGGVDVVVLNRKRLHSAIAKLLGEAGAKRVDRRIETELLKLEAGTPSNQQG